MHSPLLVAHTSKLYMQLAADIIQASLRLHALMRKRILIACIFFLVSGFIDNVSDKSLNGDAVAFSGAEIALNGIVWADVLVVKSKGVKSPQELIVVQLSVPKSE